ncbi:putative Cathepsin B [Blattamonas nauphoetae]|uniref:Cathepsin B n=1 Tax=Blattamonas nauphoetae TaxID=2049346 RepID=A0ABQ9WNL6_9EUKA|nr:putative Cathepsin B [Blattamonas nauphoetae]
MPLSKEEIDDIVINAQKQEAVGNVDEAVRLLKDALIEIELYISYVDGEEKLLMQQHHSNIQFRLEALQAAHAPIQPTFENYPSVPQGDTNNPMDDAYYQYEGDVINPYKDTPKQKSKPKNSNQSTYPNEERPSARQTGAEEGEKLSFVDKKQCGSCWAFALSEVLSDRFAIAGQDHGDLSPQDLVSCDEYDSGCQGGYLDKSWTWVELNGITTDKCLPYTSGLGMVPKCPSKCKDSSPIVRYKAKNSHQIEASQIQTELYENGPVEFGMAVYIDFMFYRRGVYHPIVPVIVGYHAVKCIGWGVQNHAVVTVDSKGKEIVENRSTEYWLCANSWGKIWGEQGYFKLKRGKDICKVESNAYAGLPVLV